LDCLYYANVTQIPKTSFLDLLKPHSCPPLQGGVTTRPSTRLIELLLVKATQETDLTFATRLVMEKMIDYEMVETACCVPSVPKEIKTVMDGVQ
jgi:hypothetical protein